MITPGHSITATERVLPRLALDFTTASLDSRVTITRALNTATRINNSGYIETVNANLPRFDFDPVTLQCKGLLIESTSENIVTYSSEFDNSAWTKTEVTVNKDTSISPDGTQNADKLIAKSVFGSHNAFVYFGLDAASRYTTSIFLKPAEYTTAVFKVLNAGGGVASYAVTLTGNGSGTLTDGITGGGTTARIDPFGNSWYRVQISWTTHSGPNSGYAGIEISPNTAGSYTGNDVNGIFVYGAQCEKKAFATSYISTTTVPQTRNADVVTMTGSNFSSWWTATIGAVTARARQYSVSATYPWLQFDDTTANNIIALRGNTTNPELYIKATTDQAQIDAGTIAADTNYGLTGAWNTNDCAASINGAAAVTDTSATIPTVTQARLGSDGTNYLNGWLQSVRYWPQRITNAETQAFSKL